MENVAIVVVTYNRIKLLQEVIESLRKQTYQEKEIIVVNNGSTDGTSDWLKQQEDLLILSQSNLGGAGGFYTGMKYAAEHNFDLCWIMDDDVVCDKDALKELIECYHSISNVGFVCSSVYSTGGIPMNSPTIDCLLNENGYARWYEQAKNNAIRVSAATFVSVLIPCRHIWKHGLPYKEFFIWGDDSEYTTRLSSLYPCYMSIKSIVVHKRSDSKALSFMNEKNPVRIQMFYYKFRNESFVHRLRHKGIKKYAFLFQYGFDVLRCFARLDLKRLRILLKYKIDTLLFNPSIQYPEFYENNSCNHSH